MTLADDYRAKMLESMRALEDSPAIPKEVPKNLKSLDPVIKAYGGGSEYLETDPKPAQSKSLSVFGAGSSVPSEVNSVNPPVARAAGPTSKVSFPSKKSKGVGPKFVQKVMPWVELSWLTKSRYPTDSEFIERWGCSYESVQLLNRNKFWLQSLRRRGIGFPDTLKGTLSDKQIAAVAVLTNLHDGRSTEAKMASLDVTSAELQGWYQDPTFRRTMTERADEAFDNLHADANMEFAKLVRKGNFNAIKLYFDMTGKTQNQEAVDVKQTVQILIESVQKNIKDPEVLEAIARDVNNIRNMKGI